MIHRPFARASAAVLSALLALLAGCGRSAETDAQAPALDPLVEAVQARFGALPIEESMPGVVRAKNQVAIRPEIAGRIVEVLADIGDAVERGRPLVRLDDSEVRERLRQAEADVRLAEAGATAARARVAELEARTTRTRALAEQRLVSAQEMESIEAELDAVRASADEAAARVEQRRAAVEERRSALAKTEVRAPVSGRLGERRAEVGMRVDPSSVLFVAGDLGELIVEIDLTEAMLATVGEGLPVVIESRATAGRPIRAELSRISPFLAEESFTTVGEIDVDNPEGWLRPGMFVNVRILVGESREATLVPVSALWENPASGQQGVFVVEGEPNPDEPGSATFRPVDLLAEGRGVAGVRGVEEGAWVVTVGQHLLSAELRTAVREAAGGASAVPLAVRARPIAWERIAELQDLQDEDLLEGFLDKQRKVAAALGAEIPESEEVVDRVLEGAAVEPPPPGGS